MSMRPSMIFLIGLALAVCATNVTRPATAQALPERPIRRSFRARPAGALFLGAQYRAKAKRELRSHRHCRKQGGGRIADRHQLRRQRSARRHNPDDGRPVQHGDEQRAHGKTALQSSHDFTVVDYVSAYPFVALTNADLGVSTLGGFVDYAKARPGQLNLGSARLGTLHHVRGTILTKFSGSTWPSCIIAAPRRPSRI